MLKSLGNKDRNKSEGNLPSMLHACEYIQVGFYEKDA